MSVSNSRNSKLTMIESRAGCLQSAGGGREFTVKKDKIILKSDDIFL